MKTKTQNHQNKKQSKNKSQTGSVSGLENRNENINPEVKAKEFNRNTDKETVLARLARWMPKQVKCAKVIGDWVWIRFACVPPIQIRTELKEHGFHWSARSRAWQHPCGKFVAAIALMFTLSASAADFSKVEKSMTWTPVHSITNDFGTVRQARTASASKVFWAEWRTNKTEMKAAGFSARPTTNGWEAIAYLK